LQYKGGPNEQCARSNPGSEALCYLTQYAYPHMSTPILIQSSQYDSFQTPYFSGSSPPYSGSTLSYVNNVVRSAFNFSMQEVRPPSAIFSPACYYHCISEDLNFYNMKIPNPSTGRLTSLNETLSAWFYTKFSATDTFSIQASCFGFNCGICPQNNK